MPPASPSSCLHASDDSLLKTITACGYNTDGALIHPGPFFTRVDNLRKHSSDAGDGASLFSMEVYPPDLNPQLVIASAEWEASSSRHLQHAIGIVDAGIIAPAGNKCGFILRDAHTTLEQHSASGEENCLLTLLHLCEYLMSMNDNLIQIFSGSLLHGFLYPGCVFMQKAPRETWISGLNLGKLCKLAGGREIITSGPADEMDLYRAFVRPGANSVEPRMADDLWAACMISLWQARGAFRQVPRQTKEFVDLCMQETGEIKRPFPRLAAILAKRLHKPEILEKEDALEALATECARALEKKAAAPEMFIVSSRQPKPFNKKGILVLDDKKDIAHARWLVTDTRSEEIVVRCNFLSKPSHPILITGPTGTGKTQLAREIHNRVYGTSGAFKSINCGMFTRELMISQVFGCIKHSHSMAFEDKPGLIDNCPKGTVFLDEVDQLDNVAQGRLLTLLDDPHEYYPLGGEGNEKYRRICTASLVFATNKDIGTLLASGEMKNDFYYRISSFFTIDLRPIASNQESLEHSVRIHWDENKRLLEATEYGDLEERFPEAWKLFIDRKLVRFDGNHRDVSKLLRHLIFRLKEKQLCREPVTITAEEAREMVIMVDRFSGSPRTETPFSELCPEEQVSRLANVVVSNPGMKRGMAAKLLGHGANVSQINRVLEALREKRIADDFLTIEQRKALGKFSEMRKKAEK